MLGDVGQRFLDDAKNCGGMRLMQMQVRYADGELAWHAGALSEVLHQPFYRRQETQIVEHQRPQVGGDPPRRRDRGVEQDFHALQFLRQCRPALPAAFPCTRRRPSAAPSSPAPARRAARARSGSFPARAPGARQRRAPATPPSSAAALPLLGRAPSRRAESPCRTCFRRSVYLRDRCVDRELLAVAAQPGDDAQRAHAPRRRAGLAEAADVIAVSGPEALGYEPGQRRADGLVPGAAEHRLRRRIEQHDVLLSSTVMIASIAESRMPRSRASLRASSDSARMRSVMSRRITVNSFRPSSACWEIDASIGNSSPSARRAISIIWLPMRRDVTPVSPKRWMCARWPSRKRCGISLSSGSPSTAARGRETLSPPRH